MHFRSLRVFATLITRIVLALPLHAQTTPAPTQKLAFEAVSIRPSDPKNTPERMFGILPTEVRVKGMPLGVLVSMAFMRQGYSRDMLTGAPAWTYDTWYDVDAKYDESTVQALTKVNYAERNELVKPLIQQLLADRCKLVYHRVPVQIDAFALVVSKGGPHLTPAVDGQPEPQQAVPTADGGKMVPFHRGELPAILHFFHATTADLARDISGTGVIVLDQTGITGHYNYDVPRTDQDNPGLDTDADIYTRAHFLDISALGLELKPIKVPADKIVIDSMEKPSPN